MHNSYKLAIIYFIFFSLLLLISAFMLFEYKLGFDAKSISHYYLGNELTYTQPKTISGLLKVVYPHIFSIGLLGMVLLHFIYFTSFRRTKMFKYLIVGAYTTFFVEIVSPFFLLLDIKVFATIKLISFILMFILFISMFWIILHSIVTQKNQQV